MSTEEELQNQQSKSESELDPETDIFNRRFNPRKFLDLPPQITLPGTRFDNFAALSAVINEFNGSCTNQIFKPKIRRPKTKAETKLGSSSSLSETTERRFLPHQQLVIKPIKAKFTHNLLTRYEKGYKGPIDRLKIFMESRIQVKVYIRKEHGIRGTVVGFIEAFDKHWNMVVAEAKEVWMRRKRKVSDQNIVFSNKLPENKALAKLTKLGLTLPTITVESIDRKHVKCTRQVAQLLIRGEQIILVAHNGSSENEIRPLQMDLKNYLSFAQKKSWR